MFQNEHNLFAQLQQCYAFKPKFIIAIDEVGRGCVAGPVLTCASLWIETSVEAKQSWVFQIKDSKKLTPVKRMLCYNNVLNEFNYNTHSLPLKNSSHISQIKLSKPKSVFKFNPTLDEIFSNKDNFKCLGFCLGEGSLEEVEQLNIWNAVQIAAGRALFGVKEYFLDALNIPLHSIVILVDGNKEFSVPSTFAHTIQATAVKGDDLFLTVGLSSILAKVHRDLFMESQDSLFPDFGFAQHKGYGTPFHMKKIQTHGVCSLHRQSFLKKLFADRI